MVSLLPSTAVMLPLPNSRWKTRSPYSRTSLGKDVDGRVKPGHDGEEDYRSNARDVISANE